MRVYAADRLYFLVRYPLMGPPLSSRRREGGRDHPATRYLAPTVRPDLSPCLGARPLCSQRAGFLRQQFELEQPDDPDVDPQARGGDDRDIRGSPLGRLTA